MSQLLLDMLYDDIIDLAKQYKLNQSQIKKLEREVIESEGTLNFFKMIKEIKNEK